MSEFVVVMKEYRVPYARVVQELTGRMKMEPNKDDVFQYAMNLVDEGEVMAAMTTVRQSIW